MDYKVEGSPMGGTVVWYEADGYRISFIDPSPGNSEYQRYLDWLSAGNEPEIIEG